MDKTWDLGRNSDSQQNLGKKAWAKMDTDEKNDDGDNDANDNGDDGRW